MNKHLDSNLYTATDIQIMKDAEDSLNPKLDRVEELIEYAKKAKLNRIGIAHCVAVKNEAGFIKDRFEQEGFKIASVDCTYGKVPFNDLIEGYKGKACNPAGQAKYLADNKTEMNIMMGLCVGHDMIFNQKSKVPVTPLVVKDRKLKHKTIDILNNNN